MANDTHGAGGTGWYGFDLDGTLAKYDGWKGIDHIGEPVKPMVDLIKRMHDKGNVVKIVTARVAPRKLDDGTVGLETAMISSEDMRQFYNGKGDNPFENGSLTHVRLDAKEIVAYWCSKNLGFIPEITHEKDHLMLELYDDRVKQVIPNEGILVETIVMDQHKELCKLADRNVVLEFNNDERKLSRLWWSMMMFTLGNVFMALALCALEACLRPEGDLHSAVEELRGAAIKFQRVSETPTVLKILGLEGEAK